MKSVDDALCEDKGLGPYALTATVEEVLKAFRKRGIIASRGLFQEVSHGALGRVWECNCIRG